MQQPINERLNKIRDKWFLANPFYYIILTSHETIIKTDLGCPICVGNGIIYIDETFYDERSDIFLEESLKAECIRILLKHPYQRMLPDKERMLMASNMVIAANVDFSELNVSKPSDIFGMKKYDKLSFEELYKLLEKENKSDYDDCCLSKIDADARTQFWDDNDYQQVMVDNIWDKIKSTPMCGKITSKFETLISDIISTEFDYRGALQRFRSTLLSSKRGLTRMKPNRRFGFDAMGSRRVFTTRLLIAIDTSGSISNDDLSRALSMINGMFKYGIETLDCIDFDTEVHEDSLISMSKRKNTIDTKYRGGTDFNDIFRYVSENQYDGVIIITDGYAEPPDNQYIKVAKHTSFLWCLNSKGNFEKMKNNKDFNKFGKLTYFI